MTFPIYQVIFFVFASVAVASALMVIFLRNPVYAVLFLVLTFVSSSVLWMLLQAEFLSLTLLFVYVGAVMTLFLFVVMMINVDLATIQQQFVRFLPIGIVMFLLLLVMLIIIFDHKNFQAGMSLPVHYGANYSNVTAMGTLLYTKYLFPFELAAVLLFVAIIAAISLAFHGNKPGTKVQNLAAQHNVRKQDRLRIISMEAEKK
jgi:NADH-quinone oxidoreductase subunit J